MSESKNSVQYIYELPFNIDKELCRLLDNDNLWKEAASHMKYSAFEINEIELTARRLTKSPTSELFSRWGQLNHNVEELFMVMYSMKYMPALVCLKPLVSDRFKRLLAKWQNKLGVREKQSCSLNTNGNHPQPVAQNTSQSSIPLPVILIEQGNLKSSHHKVRSFNSQSEESSTVGNTTSEGQSLGKVNSDLIKEHVSAIPLLQYEDLKVATNNWSTANLLGSGGFGQVFRGEWKLLTVAVKRLRDNDNCNRELIREMCLNQYRHDNILPLYGYSLGGPESCLVYQLMAGGSLEERLRCKGNRSPLTWSQRHRIAHGVARGLQFLHTMTGTPLIHGDIKPANILLDQCTTPKIGDFGLARKGAFGEERTHLKVSKVHGTRPYLPDEYLRSRCLSPAVDVFSYGVVMLQAATALPAIDNTRPAAPVLLSDQIHNLPMDKHHLVSLEDPRIAGSQESNPQLCREFILIGLHCTSYDRHRRPTMLQVFKRLDALNFSGRNVD